MNADRHVLSKQIEQRARAIAAGLQAKQWERSPRGMIARELALTLEALTLHRALDEELRRGVAEDECAIGTLLLRDLQPADEMRLRAQLQTLAAERRRLAAIDHERQRELMFRLLSLLNKHTQLSVE